MNAQQMREAIKYVYPSQSWKLKVKEMTDQQVTAIYLRFKKEGKIR